jgi:flagellar hook-basal body complex protein FliE
MDTVYAIPAAYATFLGCARIGGVELVPFPSNGHLAGEPRSAALVDAELQTTDLAIDATERLKTVLSEVKRAKADLDRSRYQADTLPSGTPDDVIQDYERRTRNAYRRWYDAQHQAVVLEAETRRRKLESLGLYLRQFEQTRDSLLAEYGDLGPHYRILVDRMAAVDTRIHIMERSGRDVDPGEFSELHKTHLSYVNQLQKYTESQKSETLTKQTQDTVSAVMVIIEHRIANQNPQLWREIVGDVRKAIEAA